MSQVIAVVEFLLNSQYCWVSSRGLPSNDRELTVLWFSCALFVGPFWVPSLQAALSKLEILCKYVVACFKTHFLQSIQKSYLSTCGLKSCQDERDLIIYLQMFCLNAT